MSATLKIAFGAGSVGYAVWAYAMGVSIKDYIKYGRESDADIRIQKIMDEHKLVFSRPVIWNDTIYGEKCQIGCVEFSKMNDATFPKTKIIVWFKKHGNIVSDPCYSLMNGDKFDPLIEREIENYCITTLEKMHSLSKWSRWFRVEPFSKTVMMNSNCKQSQVKRQFLPVR